jgi:hypothetical protein
MLRCIADRRILNSFGRDGGHSNNAGNWIFSGHVQSCVRGILVTAWVRQSLVLVTLLGLMLPSLAPANPAPGSSPEGIAVTGPTGAATVLGAAQIQALPAITVQAAFQTGHGPFKAVFSGPLLWTVLSATSAINSKAPALVRESVLVTGADGYGALLALGEIAPGFEDKQVILATMMNGKYLGARHFRIVVPGDKKGGRSVRDVLSIAVSAAGAPKP